VSVSEDIRKTLSYYKRNGLSDTFYAAKERLDERRARERYNYVPAPAELVRSQQALWQCLEGGDDPGAVFGAEYTGKHLPLISVLVPAYETDELFLRELLESVLAQTYGKWELILADASSTGKVAAVSSEYILKDSRIHYLRLPENKGISANTNAAAAAADGDYVAFLDHDDFLEPNALFEAALGILKTDCEILYTDEDKCDEKAQHYFEPNRKPDFDYDYLLTNNYICHLLVMKRGLFLALKLRSEFDGAQDYDLCLRAPKTKICHVAKILYHWRTHEGSTAGNPGSKDYAAERGRLALEQYFQEHHIHAEVEHSRHRGFYKVTYIPDIFSARRDVGVVGGKIVNRRHRIVGGLLQQDGSVLYAGRHEKESGSMHRMDTRQDAWAVDVRCMKIRDELRPLYRDVFGAPYESHILTAGTDYTEQSIRFCRDAYALGYNIVWDPDMILRID
jgi:glycosyltransferase involved in cell wall biosynthesis